MITSEMFAHLYSDSDASELNLSIGTMLTIIDHHNDLDIYSGDFEQDMSAAQSHLDAATLADTVAAEIQQMINEVNTIGPPTLPPDPAEPVRPKFATEGTKSKKTPPPKMPADPAESVRPKYISDQYADLYVEGDDSPLNQSILFLLNVLNAHYGRASVDGDFDTQVSQAEQHLAASELAADQTARIQALLTLVKEVGPPPA